MNDAPIVNKGGTDFDQLVEDEDKEDIEHRFRPVTVLTK